jgi:hypothetical protein
VNKTLYVLEYTLIQREVLMCGVDRSKSTKEAKKDTELALKDTINFLLEDVHGIDNLTAISHFTQKHFRDECLSKRAADALTSPDGD